jgi:RNA recognition motif-containing protein
MKISVPVDKATGKARGYAVITMEDVAAAERAVTWMNGKSLGGRKLFVQFWRPWIPNNK